MYTLASGIATNNVVVPSNSATARLVGPRLGGKTVILSGTSPTRFNLNLNGCRSVAPHRSAQLLILRGVLDRSGDGFERSIVSGRQGLEKLGLGALGHIALS